MSLTDQIEDRIRKMTLKSGVPLEKALDLKLLRHIALEAADVAREFYKQKENAY